MSGFKNSLFESQSLRFNDQLTPSDVCFRVKSSRKVCWGKAYRLVTLAARVSRPYRCAPALPKNSHCWNPVEKSARERETDTRWGRNTSFCCREVFFLKLVDKNISQTCAFMMKYVREVSAERSTRSLSLQAYSAIESRLPHLVHTQSPSLPLQAPLAKGTDEMDCIMALCQTQ